MKDINQLLNKISKTTNFNETERERNKINESKTDEIDFNISPIQKKQAPKSITEMVSLKTSPPEQKSNTSTNANSELIRSIIKEELDIFKEELAEFFATKTFLQESEDKETIILKIGDHVFKGKLSLVQ